MKLKVENSKRTVEVKFPDKFNSLALAQAIKSQINNPRITLASSKTRRELRGGGAKPWRQKGTGRARHGSSRSPIWVGGGKSFGPHNRKNYQTKNNSKVTKIALKHLFFLFAKNNSLSVIKQLDMPSGKTADANKFFAKYKSKKIAFVASEVSKLTLRAIANLPNVKYLPASSLHAGNLFRFSYIVITEKAFKIFFKN